MGQMYSPSKREIIPSPNNFHVCACISTGIRLRTDSIPRSIGARTYARDLSCAYVHVVSLCSPARIDAWLSILGSARCGVQHNTRDYHGGDEYATPGVERYVCNRYVRRERKSGCTAMQEDRQRYREERRVQRPLPGLSLATTKPSSSAFELQGPSRSPLAS